MVKGWKSESARHALARRGIKTKKFKTKAQAGNYAYSIYKKYGFDASIFRIKPKGSKKIHFEVLTPESLNLIKIKGWRKIVEE